jgi:hypothetical protein
MRKRLFAAALAMALAQTALAQGRGSGSGAPSDTPPPTKGSGEPPERAQLPMRESALSPPHGLLGAPGAAPDANGGSRLGRRDLELPGEAPQWTSGDRARSASSADVRAARVQAAPDLEWGAAGPAPAATPDPSPPLPAAAKAPQAKRPAR